MNSPRRGRKRLALLCVAPFVLIADACSSTGSSPANGAIDSGVPADHDATTEGQSPLKEHDAQILPPDAAEERPVVDAGDFDASESDGVASPAACGFSACAPGAPCPDLAVDQDDLIASIVIQQQQFEATSCAIVEGCILQTGLRNLLRFDTGTMNIGTADLHVGDPTQNACFTYSQCHQHYHFKGVGKYTLYAADGVTVVAVGHKQGFCLEDVYPIPWLNPPPPPAATLYSCTDQGLSMGYEDVYPNDIDCQWIDITGVPPGSYILSVVVNSEEFLPESNYANNEARAPVTIP